MGHWADFILTTGDGGTEPYLVDPDRASELYEAARVARHPSKKGLAPYQLADFEEPLLGRTATDPLARVSLGDPSKDEHLVVPLARETVSWLAQSDRAGRRWLESQTGWPRAWVDCLAQLSRVAVAANQRVAVLFEPELLRPRPE